MNQLIDDILTLHEDLWRDAALTNRAQFFGTQCGGGWVDTTPGQGLPTCAVLINPAWSQFRTVLVQWTCPLCAHLPTPYHARDLSQVFMHLNNAHRFLWLDLANKTRDLLAQGLR